jgi:hypothetical protein
MKWPLQRVKREDVERGKVGESSGSRAQAALATGAWRGNRQWGKRSGG